MDGSDRNTAPQDLSTSLVWRTLHHGAPGLAAGAVLGLMGVSVAQALPVGGTVAPIAGNGSATISSTQNATTVVQSGSKVVLDWNSFNIGAGQSVTFVQPGSRAVAYNRINDPGLTSIDGALKANGQVWLFNSNGIAFGTHATVNVAGLLASTLQADPAAFLRGDTLTLTGRAGDGSVTNAGSINAGNGADGYAVLAGNSVGNAGTVDVAFGTVELAAGRVATISSYDTGLLNFALSSASGDASTSNTAAALSAVANSGSLKGGNVRLDANVAGNLFANAVNTSGIVRAQRIDTSGGTIRLVGEGGGVIDTGTLDASGATGGDVQVVGSNVTIAGTASIDADALVAGNGGHVFVWADDLMTLNGAITARGGAAAGDGGFIETSSGNAVQIHSAPNASAAHGAAGQWLIDPTNITIIHNAGPGGTISGGGSGTASTIDDGDINAALAADTDVTIDTSVVNTGGNTGTITENANAIINNNTSNTPRSLTLNANSDVTLKGTIQDATGANLLNVAINSDGVVDTSLGTINVNGGLTIGGFTPATATGGAVTFGATTVGGKIVVDAGGAITEAGAITTGANGSSFTAAGNIDLSTQANSLFGLDTAGNNTFAPGADLLVRNVGAIQLGTTTITGKLVLISDTSTITQTGVLTTGATGNSFTTSTANQNIDLSTSTNAFTGTVALNTSGTGTAAIKDTSLNFGNSTIGGALTATATTGGITESGPIAAGGNSSFTASSANQNIDLSTSTNAFTGTVALNTSGTGTAAIKAGSLNFGTSGIGGALTATATAGNITESGAITTGANGSSFSATGNIDLSTQANSLSGLGTAAANTFTSGGDLLVRNVGAIQLGTSTITGKLVLISDTGGITETGVLTTGATGNSFTASSANQNIDLSTFTNAFTGTVALNTSGTGTAAIKAGSLNFGTSSIGGALTATATTGNITESGAITTGANGSTFSAAAGSIDLSTQANSLSGLGTAGGNTFISGGDLLVRNVGAIQIGASTITGKLVLISDTGGITETGVLTTGATGNSFTASSANQNIDLSTFTNAFTGTVALHTAGAGTAAIKSTSLNFGASSVGGALTATATTGGITESAAITAGAGSGFTASTANQSIDLSTFTNAFAGTVALNTSGTGNAAIKAGSLNLATSNIGGALTATATSGGITESGALTTGATGNSFTASSANQNIDLSTFTNAFTGTVALNTSGTGTAAIKAGALNFGASSVGGALTATATTGGISESGAITAGGNSIFTTSTAGQSINLATSTNTFYGTVALNTSGAGNAAIKAGSLNFGTSSIGGALTATATTGGITQSGAITTGASGSSFTSAAGSGINLSTQANSFSGLSGGVTFSSGGDLLIRNVGAIQLGATNVTGKLVLISDTGSITEAGVITTGATGNSFTTSAANQIIDLSTFTNAFTGTVALNTSGTGTAAIKATALNFGASNVGGAFTATAATGGITESGAIAVGGNSSFTASSANQNIDLSSSTNAFTGTVAVNTSGTGTAAIKATSLNFGTSTIGGALTATATTGGITESGVITTGANGSSFTAAAGTIDLSTQANSLFGLGTAGNDAFTSGANLLVRNVGAIQLGTSTIAGKLVLISDAGGITETGVLTTGATGNSFTASSANQNIDLSSSTNAFTGTVALNTSGTGTAAIKATSLNFGASTIGGALTATATTGGIAESGAITAGGNSNFTASTAGQSINLATSTNAFGGTVGLNTSGATGNAAITSAALNLGTSNVGGTLTETAATGGITESGVITAGGASSFTASTAGQSINLATSTNVLGGPVTLATSGAGNASVTALALNLATSNVGGGLTATATTGGITEGGVLTTGGASSFTTSGANQTIDLSTQTNAFGGTVALNTNGTGGNAKITSASLNFGASNVGGALNATATTGNISQTGAITASAANGLLNLITATAGSINLGTSPNVLNGTVEALAKAGSVALTSTALSNVEVFAKNNVTLSATAGNIGALSAYSSGGAITASASGSLVVQGADAGTGTVSLGSGGTITQAVVYNAVDPAFSPSDIAIRGSSVALNAQGFGSSGNFLGVLTNSLALTDPTASNAFFAVARTDGTQLSTSSLTFNGSALPVTPGVFLNITGLPATTGIGSAAYVTFVNSQIPYSVGGGLSSEVILANSLTPAENQSENQAGTGNLNVVIQSAPDASVSLFNIVGLCLPADQRIDEDAAAHENCTTRLLPERRSFEEILLGAADTRADARGPGL